MKIEDNILNQKLELIQWLSTIEDKSTIEKLIALKNNEDKDWWDLISKKEKQSIENGIEDAEQGKLEPHSRVKKMYERWL